MKTKIFLISLVTLSSILFSGCSEDVVSESGPTTVGTFRTQKFDGHLWLTWKQGYGGGVTHHPDCHCNIITK